MAASIIPELNNEPSHLSETAMAWYDRLDRIDPFFGDLGEFENLVRTAWLTAQVASNRQFFARVIQQ
jgi:hypothetical protein